MTWLIRVPLAWPLAAVLVCLLAAAAPAAAAAPPAPATPAGAGVVAVSAAGPAAPGPVLASGPWNSAWNLIESSLNSRAGLLRLGVVGMIIALFIIMFGNKWSK